MRFFSFGDGGNERGPGRGHGRRRRRRGRHADDLTLNDIRNGKKFRVRQLVAAGEIRQRLLDMGFVRGTTGRVLREALLKDPIELEMPGYKVSLRRAEARQILVEEIE